MNSLPLSQLVISYVHFQLKPRSAKHYNAELVPGPIHAVPKCSGFYI